MFYRPASFCNTRIRFVPRRHGTIAPSAIDFARSKSSDQRRPLPRPGRDKPGMRQNGVKEMLRRQLTEGEIRVRVAVVCGMAHRFPLVGRGVRTLPETTIRCHPLQRLDRVRQPRPNAVTDERSTRLDRVASVFSTGWGRLNSRISPLTLTRATFRQLLEDVAEFTGFILNSGARRTIRESVQPDLIDDLLWVWRWIACQSADRAVARRRRRGRAVIVITRWWQSWSADSRPRSVARSRSRGKA